MKEFQSQYENKYGERWLFTYDYSAGVGTITGSDVSWENYQVINGHAIGLILNERELNWLRLSWDNATKAAMEIHGKDTGSSRHQENQTNH